MNELYLLANQWLKTTGTSQSRLASMFVTKLNMPDLAQTPGKGKAKGKNEINPKPENVEKKTKGEPKTRAGYE